tara:strand:+ start:487 stop:645 length:159 start_codon:yes stop_codon:yes gene_type:complete
MSKDLLKALMTANKEEASSVFGAAMNAKKDEALQVKKVAVATDIFNARNVKG